METRSRSTDRIQQENDRFRQGYAPGRLLVTASIASLGSERMGEILRSVRSFNAFDEDNDPFGEHDFGALTVGGLKIFWKIDYYDKDLRFASSDPADPTVTLRVLTVMRAEDY